MIVDLGPVIYAVLMLYVAGGIVLVVLGSLGAWGIAACAKKLHQKTPRPRTRAYRFRSILHLPQHGRA